MFKAVVSSRCLMANSRNYVDLGALTIKLRTQLVAGERRTR